MSGGEAIGEQTRRSQAPGEEAAPTPMRSPVNWALLGLIIERPTYAYDLAQRFERRYQTVLALSNVGHVYTALAALEGRALVEEIPGTRVGRQPKPHYRATPEGARAYRQWLIGQADADRKRGRLFVLALAALASQPERALEVVAGYEQAWLAEGMHTTIGGESETEAENAATLLRRLLDEEARVTVGAKLEWIEYARHELAKLAAHTGRQR